MHRYNSYSDFFRRIYGSRLQKLSIDAGFSCPNRGNRENAGCTFCLNDAFNPSYCTPEKSITQQLDEGILFHRHRYPNTRHYLAYFQAYSNTYAPEETLRQRYLEALSHPDVCGLVISTRPDCVDDRKLDLIASLAALGRESRLERDYFIALEYGIESCYDETLKRVNRGHDFETSRRAIMSTAERNIHCGAHLIIGLPGESRQQIIDEVGIINSLPINSLKLHQLQIFKGTPMEKEAMENPELYRQFSLEEYIKLVCDFLERLRPDIMIERLAGEVPPRYQAFPDRSWRRADGKLIRNEEIPQLVNKELENRNSRQGGKGVEGS